LATLAEKYPPLPELPRDFYGPYQPVNEFDCLKAVNARRVCSYYGLLTHNETFWKFELATNPVPQLQRMIAQLTSAGWKVGTADTNTEYHVIDLHQDGARLRLFRVRAEIGPMALAKTK